MKKINENKINEKSVLGNFYLYNTEESNDERN